MGEIATTIGPIQRTLFMQKLTSIEVSAAPRSWSREHGNTGTYTAKILCHATQTGVLEVHECHRIRALSQILKSGVVASDKWINSACMNEIVPSYPVQNTG